MVPFRIDVLAGKVLVIGVENHPIVAKCYKESRAGRYPVAEIGPPFDVQPIVSIFDGIVRFLFAEDVGGHPKETKIQALERLGRVGSLHGAQASIG